MSHRFLFFQEALLALLGCKDIKQGLYSLFRVIQRYFPVEAMTFDQSTGEDYLFVHYIVTDKGFFDVQHRVPLTPADAEYVKMCEDKLLTLHFTPSCMNHDLSLSHSQLLTQFIPLKDRGYMVAILHVDGNVVGHLVFLGTQVNCFTEEHARYMELLLPACAHAMTNMLELQDIYQENVRMRDEQNRLKHELDMLTHGDLVGAQGGLRAVVDSMHQLANKDTPVLILGETGTGKELVANAIQRQSTRADKPFIKVNCGALSDTLLDSELFGHERGAFTGAMSMRQGRFEQADGGTLFLDEVGELSPQAQVRLLRVLQDGTFERIGGRRHITVDVRIIAATNRDLRIMCRRGLFREDLYHRLNVFPINMPPLRQRREDIPLLICYLAERIAARLGVAMPTINLAEMDRIMQYAWPGNVRELENLVERAFILHPAEPLDLGRLIHEEDSAHAKRAASTQGAGSAPMPGGADTLHGDLKGALQREGVDLESYLEEKFRQWHHRQSGEVPQSLPPGTFLPVRQSLDADMTAQISRALEACNGKVYGPGGAAEMLHVNHNTLRSRMRKLGINPASLRRRPQ